jgi:hypothetical protein
VARYCGASDSVLSLVETLRPATSASLLANPNVLVVLSTTVSYLNSAVDKSNRCSCSVGVLNVTGCFERCDGLYRESRWGAMLTSGWEWSARTSATVSPSRLGGSDVV